MTGRVDMTSTFRPRNATTGPRAYHDVAPPPVTERFDRARPFVLPRRLVAARAQPDRTEVLLITRAFEIAKDDRQDQSNLEAFSQDDEEGEKHYVLLSLPLRGITASLGLPKL